MTVYEARRNMGMGAEDTPKLPLDGVKVLDLSAVIMGPYCTQILADLGADIIKVESPEGDIIRNVGPSKDANMAAMFLANNRGKQSISLDLSTAKGREICLKLAKSADIFVHSMRPSSLKKIGLDYEAVRAVSPDIIYCALVGFGLDGPYAGKPAYDDIIQSAGGLTALESELHGKPGYAATVVADKVSSLTAAYSIMAALIARMRGAGGQYLEVAMFETMVSFNLVEHACGAIYSQPIGRAAYSRVLSKHRYPYRTKTFDITALVHTDIHFAKFWTAVGRQDVLDDPRFVNIAARTLNVDAYYQTLAEEFTKRPGEEWIEMLEAAAIPVQKINTLDELYDDEHLTAVGFFNEIEQPGSGTIRVPGSPVKFSGTPPRVSRHTPTLGEDGPALLAQLGYSPEEIGELRRNKILFGGDNKGQFDQ